MNLERHQRPEDKEADGSQDGPRHGELEVKITPFGPEQSVLVFYFVNMELSFHLVSSCHFAQANSGEIDFAQIHISQVDPIQDGTKEIGPSQGGAAQIGPAQVRPTQRGSKQAHDA